jgi:hypothetical protein
MALSKPKKMPDPSQTSAATKVMAPRLAKISALMGGTEAMREAGQVLLPQYEAESDKNYSYRLSRAVLLNIFKRAVETMVGKPFSKSVQTKDFDPSLEPLIEDVDNNGNNLNTFARNVFQCAIADGLTHVLVEYPDIAAEAPKTLEDERKLSARPYFCHIPHCSIVAAYSETVNGTERLTHVRILEEETVRDGFDEGVITRIRVLEPGRWELWRKDDNKWVREKQGNTTISEIPLLTFYADREEFMIARPPLTDLADLNIAHWQSSSDQRNILTLTRFPLLAGSGLNDEEANIKIGPNKLLTSQSKDGKFYYVEHSGAAIASGRQDLQDLKDEMAIMSVQLLQSKPGTITATEKSIDTAQSTSALQDIAMRFGDFLERCFSMAATWLNLKLEKIGSVSLNTDFGLTDAAQADLTALIQLRTMKEISHEQFIIELKRRNLIADDFDVEADLAQLQKEEDRALELEIMRNDLLGVNPDGSLKDAPKEDDDKD